MKETKFKETEIGLIPEDWEIVPLSSIGSFSKGAGISRSESASGNIPAIRYGEVYTVHNDYIKRFYSHISPEVARTSKKIKKGDLLFTASGETKEDIAKCVAFDMEETKEAYAGGDIIILSPKQGMNSTYLGVLFNSKEIVKQKASKAQGDAVVHITTGSLASIITCVPKTVIEQDRIASSLTDIDSLIDSLDSLIAKKQAIKEGAMQQLLTGKKRLEGFDEPWVEVKLGDVLCLGNGRDYKHLGKGPIPVYGTGGYMTSVSDYLYEGETVCIGRKGTIDEPQYHNGKIWTVDTLFYTYGYKNVAVKYIYYLFMTIDWLCYNEASGVPSLTSKTVLNINVNIPSSVNEQTAIANILSDMDDEIDALKQKRDKYIAIKDGMMQQLLTGKIRLV